MFVAILLQFLQFLQIKRKLLQVRNLFLDMLLSLAANNEARHHCFCLSKFSFRFVHISSKLLLYDPINLCVRNHGLDYMQVIVRHQFLCMGTFLVLTGISNRCILLKDNGNRWR